MDEKTLKLFKLPTGLLPSTLLLLLAFTFLLLKIVIPSTGHMTHGFSGYYTASLLLVKGQLGPQAYDNEWFIQQVHAVVQQPIAEILTPTLPTVSLLVVPFTFLSPQFARDTWIWFNLSILLAALGFLAAILPRPNQNGPQLSAWLTIIALAFVFSPVAANFYIGQAFILFLGLFVLTLFGLLNRQDELAGLSLGLIFILKTAGLSLWLLLLMQRRWKALSWGIGTVVTVALLSLPWIGWDTWLAYLQAVWYVTNGPTVAVTAYQTTIGFFTHLLRFDPVWNPHPVYHWPALALILTLVVSVATVTVTLWLGRHAPTPNFFAALVPLSIILLPKAEEYHFTLLLIPIFILINDLIQHPPPAGFFSLDWLLLGIALFLLMLPIRYDSLSLSADWLALLAYPRLYGAWLIWLVAIRRLAPARLHLQPINQDVSHVVS